jgi:hypothetical protein
MTETLKTRAMFRITVTAASPAAPLAIPFIAGKLGIEPARVAAQLASLPAVLAEALPDREARDLATMLSLIGLPVRLDPALSDRPVAAEAVDMAIHLAEGADRTAAVAALARVLGGAADPAALDRASGLVLTGLAAAEQARIGRALTAAGGLRVTVSARSSAVYDLFAPRSPRLCAEISRLGLGRCRLSGALAGALNLTTARRLLALAGPAAVLIDRAFQRHDLWLQAAPGLSRAELLAFLETRPGADRTLLRRTATGHALRLDADLARPMAARFIEDYAAIGIDARARMRGRLAESR